MLVELDTDAWVFQLSIPLILFLKKKELKSSEKLSDKELTYSILLLYMVSERMKNY
jgi:hypothetical protein